MIYSNLTARKIDEECRSTLKLLRQRVRSLKAVDPVQQHITRYAVILCSGAIERSVKVIVVDHVKSGATPEVINYLSATILQGGMNPQIDKIQKLVGKFNGSWSSGFKKRLKNVSSRSMGYLKSLVDNRNEVAHGKPITISFQNVVDYYCGARNVVGELEKALV